MSDDRQELHLALQLVLGLELLHQVLVALDPLDAELHLLGQDLGLQVVVVEHVGHDVLRARLQQHVALVHRELSALHGEVQQDLDVHLVVGGVDARRVVDEVGVDAAALLRVLHPASLGEAEVPALAHDACAHLVAVDPNGVVRAVAHLGVALAVGLDVGADAAVPEQIDGRLQRPMDHLVGGHLLGGIVGDPERRPCLWRQRHALRRPVDDAPPSLKRAAS